MHPGDLLRAYFAQLESRQETDDALAERTLLIYEGSAKRLMRRVEHAALAEMSEPWVLAVRVQLLGDYAVRTVKADLKSQVSAGGCGAAIAQREVACRGFRRPRCE